MGASLNDSNRTSTPTAPSAELFDFNLGGTERLTMAYRIETGAGTVAVDGALAGGTANWSAVGVAYKADPAGAAERVMARSFNPVPFL